MPEFNILIPLKGFSREYVWSSLSPFGRTSGMLYMLPYVPESSELALLGRFPSMSWLSFALLSRLERPLRREAAPGVGAG
jgi:hypothetical protein